MNSPASETTVLVVGAGPTGLTLACELARAGVSHRLVESSPGPARGSRGKGVQPRTLEVLEDIGCVDHVLSHGQMAMPIRSTGPDGQVSTAGGPSPEQRPDVPYPASVITPQWRTEEALRHRLTQLGGTVEHARELRSLQQVEGSVSAVLTDGDGEEEINCRWVVGCDGGHSVVRRQAGIDFEGETLDSVRMIVADLAVEGLDRDAWQMWRHEEGLVSLCPLPSTDTFQYQAGIAPGQDPDLDLVNLQAILDRRSGCHDVRLGEPRWSSLWRANIRLVETYRRRGVCLAGDAAHIHSPAGGQGMNTGIQDAHNLAWKLAAVASGAPLDVLDTYEAERRPVAAGVLALSNDRLRQTLEGKGIPIHADTSTTQLGITYRNSSLSSDDRGDDDRLRAGDRAPDAPGLTTIDGKRRLHELLGGGRFTLVSFGVEIGALAGSAGLDIVRVVDSPRRPGDVVDSAGHAARAYGVTGKSLVLVRPDGYIALISDAGSTAEVEKRLAVLGLRRQRG